MKILCFVDMHESCKALKKLKETVKKDNPDAIVCAGDISIFESRLDEMIRSINTIGKPVFIVHGNHEEEITMERICSKYSNVFFIHGSAAEFNNVVFIGWGGGGFEKRDREFEALLPQMKKALADAEKAVFVSHAPPYRTKLDLIIDESCGSRSIREFIKSNTKKIKVAVSGHLHENSGKKDRIGDTIVLNPGPFGKIITI